MCPVPSDAAHLRGAAAARPSNAPSYRAARRIPPAARRAPAPLPPRGAPGGCCHLQLLPRHGRGAPKQGHHLLQKQSLKFSLSVEEDQERRIAKAEVIPEPTSTRRQEAFARE